MEVLLKIAFEALLKTLFGRVTDGVFAKLKEEPASRAYKLALGRAIKRYANEGRTYYASALLNPEGILSLPDVSNELAQIFIFERQPNAALIARYWRDSLDNPSNEQEFTKEAQRFLTILSEELRATDIFRPVFNSRTIQSIEVNTAISASQLVTIQQQLEDLSDLLNSRFGELLERFSHSSPDIKSHIRDFTEYIEDKTKGFIGRQFLFETFQRFQTQYPRGYFIIRGDPGIGKTAFIGEMVKQGGYVHHFNIRAEGINRADAFLSNICAQLIAQYNLEYSFLPLEAKQDAGFLNKLLSDISKRLENQKCIIIVDGLDEVDSTETRSSNLLFLPTVLPENIYLVVTTRNTPLSWRIDCESQTLDVEHDSNENIADIRDYLYSQLNALDLSNYLLSQKLSNDQFVELFVNKSEGNFMYLRYVVPEIAAGVYDDVEINEIPLGLKNYYDAHWQRIKAQSGNDWFELKLPILVTLSVALEPISIDFISGFSQIDNKVRIQDVLEEWRQFLHSERVASQGQIETRFRFYHASFIDFIASKELVIAERVNLEEARKMHAEHIKHLLNLSNQ